MFATVSGVHNVKLTTLTTFMNILVTDVCLGLISSQFWGPDVILLVWGKEHRLTKQLEIKPDVSQIPSWPCYISD